MKLSAVLIACAWAALLLPLPLGAQVTIRSNFESGNGELVSFSGTTLEWDIEPDTNSSDTQWFYFAVDGAAGQRLLLRFVDPGGTNVPSHWNIAVPIYSTDNGDTWQHIPETPNNSNGYQFFHDFTVEGERLAFHYPYTATDAYLKIYTWDDNPNVTRTRLGESVQGRPIEHLLITDSSFPDDDKIGVWIIGRQHSAEVTASFTVEGLVDFLLSDDPVANTLRRGVLFNIVPMVNPDGVHAGNYRDNAAGVNLNRVWNGTANNSSSPEVVVIEDAIDAWVAAGNPYHLFLDFHSTSGQNPHFAFHGNSTVSAPNYPTPETYFADSRAFLQLVNAGEPAFNPFAGSTSSNDQRLAYHRQRIRHGVLAFTPEGAYVRHYYGSNSNALMTPGLHRSVGEAFARAIHEYYDVESIASIGSVWMNY